MGFIPYIYELYLSLSVGLAILFHLDSYGVLMDMVHKRQLLFLKKFVFGEQTITYEQVGGGEGEGEESREEREKEGNCTNNRHSTSFKIYAAIIRVVGNRHFLYIRQQVFHSNGNYIKLPCISKNCSQMNIVWFTLGFHINGTTPSYIQNIHMFRV